jgi:hypothetical protein
MVTVRPTGTDGGAVYSPKGEIVPTAALPPGTPFTDQLYRKLRSVDIQGENWSVCSTAIVADAGDSCVEFRGRVPALATWWSDSSSVRNTSKRHPIRSKAWAAIGSRCAITVRLPCGVFGVLKQGESRHRYCEIFAGARRVF